MKLRAIILNAIIGFSLTNCLETASIGIISAGIVSAKDKSVGETIDDMKISAQIKKELAVQDFRHLYIKVNVEVVQGRVMFTGSVEAQEDLVKAIDIAWSVPGVKEVINEIIVDKDSSKFNAAQYTKDTWITTQIKSKTLLDKDVKFSNYTVVTSNNIVYLFGIGRSDEEVSKVANIAASVKGVDKVVSHVKVGGSEVQPHITPNT